jgi:hypothetical protein
VGVSVDEVLDGLVAVDDAVEVSELDVIGAEPVAERAHQGEQSEVRINRGVGAGGVA